MSEGGSEGVDAKHVAIPVPDMVDGSVADPGTDETRACGCAAFPSSPNKVCPVWLGNLWIGQSIRGHTCAQTYIHTYIHTHRERERVEMESKRQYERATRQKYGTDHIKYTNDAIGGSIGRRLAFRDNVKPQCLPYKTAESVGTVQASVESRQRRRAHRFCSRRGGSFVFVESVSWLPILFSHFSSALALALCSLSLSFSLSLSLSLLVVYFSGYLHRCFCHCRYRYRYRYRSFCSPSSPYLQRCPGTSVLPLFLALFRFGVPSRFCYGGLDISVRF